MGDKRQYHSEYFCTASFYQKWQCLVRVLPFLVLWVLDFSRFTLTCSSSIFH
jgi:hypothetical protein